MPNTNASVRTRIILAALSITIIAFRLFAFDHSFSLWLIVSMGFWLSLGISGLSFAIQKYPTITRYASFSTIVFLVALLTMQWIFPAASILVAGIGTLLSAYLLYVLFGPQKRWRKFWQLDTPESDEETPSDTTTP